MKCPICGKEFSEPVMPFHIERCKENIKTKETPQKKKIEQMNKDELLNKAKELEIVIEDIENTTKAQIIEMIKTKETPQE
ncbi:MAG: DNA gyrase inhibitor YacG [Clostridia bacterium]|nr:DNA gyrase inhibitor YacG [Clostridia bacterium]